MGYYAISLDEFIQKICTVIFNWGVYNHQGLIMRVYNATNMFYDKTRALFQDMKQVCEYIDDLVLIKNYTFENHMDILDEVIIFFKSEMQIIEVECKWDHDSITFLGFLMTW